MGRLLASDGSWLGTDPAHRPSSMSHSRTPARIVVTLTAAGGGHTDSHENASRAEVARRLAALLHAEFAGEHDPAARYEAPLYYVPCDTLLVADAAALGIRSENALFGGVVPEGFVATKAITHPLIAPGAFAPPGWSEEFGARVRDAVPPGATVFDLADARRAGRKLLQDGALRLKPVRATGGRGQVPIDSPARLDDALQGLDEAEIRRYGLVLERQLEDVVTYSVGQVRVGALVASYYGTQRLTPDNAGELVYGGSDLTIVRGDWEPLIALPDLDEATRDAIAQARIYDRAADACFGGFFASRRNYDVIEGVDAAGRRHRGVLEQSWRIGGASGAEVAALEAFDADAALRCVRASCVEIFGDSGPPPAGATVYYRGTDARVGSLTKYTMIHPHETRSSR